MGSPHIHMAKSVGLSGLKERPIEAVKPLFVGSWFGAQNIMVCELVSS